MEALVSVLVVVFLALILVELRGIRQAVEDLLEEGEDGDDELEDENLF